MGNTYYGKDLRLHAGGKDECCCQKAKAVNLNRYNKHGRNVDILH